MKIVIIEDEQPAAIRLIKMINSIVPEAEIDGPLDSVEQSVNWFEEHNMPDLIFMDIQLGDDTCFEIFNLLTITAPVIFTTAYDEYAVQAFKTNAIDYLLKPLKREEVEAAIYKFQRQRAPIQNYTALINAYEPKQVNRFLIKQGAKFKIIELKDISYFLSEQKITYLVQADGKRSAIEYTIEKLSELVDPKIYFRANRQFLISIHSILDMVVLSKSKIKVNLLPASKEECIVSSERSALFKEWLAG